jgi:glutamate/tyrosine decarboxylase-like PLP-dependent enzyme
LAELKAEASRRGLDPRDFGQLFSLKTEWEAAHPPPRAGVEDLLGLIGLGRDRVRRVPADDHGRMRADRLPEDVTGPAVICVQAGEVNTGAFDPFPAVAKWARPRRAWVHVDGAFGLWALADPSRCDLTVGLTDADSWATDAHKWLNVPYDCGIALVRRPEDLRRSFASVAGYLPPIPVSKPCSTRRRPRNALGRSRCGRSCAR